MISYLKTVHQSDQEYLGQEDYNTNIIILNAVSKLTKFGYN